MTTLGPTSHVAIVGGGCAGYSLACEMIERCPGVHITIFDPQLTPNTHRTWCFWETARHHFTDSVCKRWERLAVRSGTSAVTVEASRYPYACIRASDFFRAAEEKLSHPSCTVRRGVSVEGIDEQELAVELEVREGHHTSAERFTHVFDSRPPSLDRNDSREPLLLQHFGGIELDASSAPVDTTVATLMDFNVSQQHGAHFMYVLPFEPTRVLVESTFITPDISEGIDYQANAHGYASEMLGLSQTAITYKESGVLPMTLRQLAPAPTARVWPIGTRAGVMRASSGYAFAAIQADAVRVVDALRAGHSRPGPPRSPLLGMLDRVLLSLLDHEPSAASDLFPALFANASSERLIRFLADIPRTLDYLAVIWAMPKRRVISHLLTHRSAWPGRL